MWQVSWLPESPLGRNEATTAIVLADTDTDTDAATGDREPGLHFCLAVNAGAVPAPRSSPRERNRRRRGRMLPGLRSP